MTKEVAPNKKEIINWEKKSASDAARISKRLEGRAELEDAATTENSTKLRKPASPSPQSLNRLRKKIKEVYDDEDEDEEESTFFNINLLGDEALQDEEAMRNRQEQETIRISKEQQKAGKLGAIMSANMAAKEVGLSDAPTLQDERLLNSAEYDPQKIRREVFKQKITKPLRIKGEIPTTDMEKSLQGIKNIQEQFSSEELKNLPAEDMKDFAEERDENELAKLILKKSGRRAPTKKLSEQIKEMNKKQNTPMNYNEGKEND